MKKYCLVIMMLVMGCFKIQAQETADDLSAIKLFLDPYVVYRTNNNLAQNLQDRLYRKVTQLINQTGITEIGYSTFLVVPKFDILSTSVDQAGITQVHMAECEIGISIKRADFGDNGGATFSSFSKTIIGSGSTKDEAITNAINNLSSKDKDIVDFFNKSKIKIDAYFKAHCKDVMKEANQALALKDYEKSIALYFSIPSNCSCYKDAFDATQKVYVTYVEDQCNKKLVMLKSFVALAQSENTNRKNYFDSALNIMRSLSPASAMCYQEAKVLIGKIEQRLDEKQKQEWELTKRLSSDDAEVKKEMYKAMGRISSNYQPAGPSTNVIIAH